MLTWRIARRMAGRLGAAVAVLPVLVVSVFSFAVNVFLDEQTLSGEQEVASELGEYGAALVRLSVTFPPGSPVPGRIASDLRDRGVEGELALLVPDLPLHQLSADGIYYRETRWRPDPFPDALALRSGRLPQTPGEVALVGEVGAETAVGDTVSVLGHRDALTVVGLVDPAVDDRQEVLAAPGTWASLRPSDDPTSAGLEASFGFYFRDGSPGSDVATVANVIADRWDLAAVGASRERFVEDAVRSVRTRQIVEQRTQDPWTSRSPMSNWIPTLLLTPLAVLLAFQILLRRLAPAARVMVGVGVRRSTAVLGLATAVMVWVVGAVAAGLLAGVALGHAAAEIGAQRGWSNPAPTWRFPMLALGLTAGGVVAGAAGASVLLGSRVRARGARRTGEVRGAATSTVATYVRRSVAALAVAAFAVQATTLRDPTQGLVLGGLVVVAAGLLAPDLTRAWVARLPLRRLSDRLVQRVLAAWPARAAGTVAVLVVGIAACSGFLTTLSIAVAVDRQMQEPVTPAGTVAVDGDGMPWAPVPASIRKVVAETPGFRNGSAVVLRPLGVLVRDDDGRPVDLSGSVGTPDLPGVSFALDTLDDIARTVGRTLRAAETATLEGGGVLVISDRVAISEGAVELVDNATTRTRGSYAAARAEIEPVPWFDGTPVLMLTSTARERGLPLSTGAEVYTEVAASQARLLVAALAAAGIDPENAEVHRAAPPVLPDAALIVSAVALFAVVVTVASAAARGQARSLRLWSSRLTQLGVPSRWAKGVVGRQQLWLVALAVPVGLVAGVLPVVAMRLSFESLPVVVPWAQIVVLVVCILGAMVAASVLAMRSLSASEALGWRDGGE